MSENRRRPAVVIGLAAAVLALVAAAWHVTALAAYSRTAGSAPLPSRLASAELAARLEPWDARFGWRVTTLRAQQLLDAGKIDPAFWLLQPLAQTVRGDALYRSVYQEAVRLKTPLDSRKAHVQHAKEKAGGVLLEQDVQH